MTQTAPCLFCLKSRNTADLAAGEMIVISSQTGLLPTICTDCLKQLAKYIIDMHEEPNNTTSTPDPLAPELNCSFGRESSRGVRSMWTCGDFYTFDDDTGAEALLRVGDQLDSMYLSGQKNVRKRASVFICSQCVCKLIFQRCRPSVESFESKLFEAAMRKPSARLAKITDGFDCPTCAQSSLKVVVTLRVPCNGWDYVEQQLLLCTNCQNHFTAIFRKGRDGNRSLYYGRSFPRKAWMRLESHWLTCLNRNDVNCNCQIHQVSADTLPELLSEEWFKVIRTTSATDPEITPFSSWLNKSILPTVVHETMSESLDVNGFNVAFYPDGQLRSFGVCYEGDFEHSWRIELDNNNPTGIVTLKFGSSIGKSESFAHGHTQMLGGCERARSQVGYKEWICEWIGKIFAVEQCWRAAEIELRRLEATETDFAPNSSGQPPGVSSRKQNMVPLGCPQCTRDSLQRVDAIELDDPEWNEQQLQMFNCGHCHLHVVGWYRESRRGALSSEGGHYDAIPLNKRQSDLLRAWMRTCPSPLNVNCKCAAHKWFNRQRECLSDFFENPIRFELIRYEDNTEFGVDQAPQCSLCNTPLAEVRRLIKGNVGGICEECVDFATNTIDKQVCREKNGNVYMPILGPNKLFPLAKCLLCGRPRDIFQTTIIGPKVVICQACIRQGKQMIVDPARNV